MFLCCWRICLVCLALELVGPCVVLGFSVGMEAFDLENSEKDGNTRPPDQVVLTHLYASQEATVRTGHGLGGAKMAEE